MWTAGHCVYETYYNNWNRKFTFCPGYRNGTCPLGQWTAKQKGTTPQWQNATCVGPARCTESEWNHDLAALVINPLNGYTIQRWVGSHALRYNIQIRDHYAFGYPADAPFDGLWLYACIATNTTYAPGPNAVHLSIPCRATGGASGGPWLAGFNADNRAWLDSVNSHFGGTNVMHGTFQGASAQTLYDTLRYNS